MKSPQDLKLLLLVLFLSVLTDETVAQTSPDQLLLKNYRPNSIFRIPQTKVPKAKFPVIDMHSHPYLKTDEEIARWVKIMDEVGIEKTIVMTKVTGAQFDEIIARYKKYPGRFSVWCGFLSEGYDKPGYAAASVAELERCAKMGAEGVGELGDKGKGLYYSDPPTWGMHIDDSRLDPVLEKCADLHLPVNVHVADPYWMYQPMDEHNDGLMAAYAWRLDNQTNGLGFDELLATLERAVRKHPRTTFIACHFANCNHDPARLGDLLDKFPNLYSDIGARYGETAAIPRFMKRFFEKHQDRLLYGTDLHPAAEMYQSTFRVLETEDEHFYGPSGYHWPLQGLGLPEKVLKKVYHSNAQRILQKH